MSHPLVEFLLARYDEEDPDRTDPDVNARRERATATECHLITGDEPYDRYRSVRAVAWLALRVAGARYHTHPDYLDEWLPPILSGRPDEEGDVNTPLSLPIKLRKCLKPDCMRKVKEGVAYCCAECAVAAEGKYEIHEHSEWCDKRNDERGECDEYEALLLRQ